jgi:dienelactone hydrolase
MVRFGSHVDGYHDVADQMARDLRRRADAHFRRQEREKAAITSIEAFEARRDRIRSQFLRAIGGLPEDRTPLNSQITGRIERNGFHIEKLLYESQPQVHVTALLYVPNALKEPAPAVVFVHGHAEIGKAYPHYQAVCSDLARNGFVALAPDPPGQGERYQYLDPMTGEQLIKGCTTEHTYAGLQYVLRGASIARHFTWDAIRGVDYLISRPDVDGSKIGVTGNSGGGLQTCFMMMAEPRLAAAVPCTFPMTLESYFATGQPQDSEQIVYGAIAHGPDHDDYLTALAPRPVMVGAVAYDFFPIEGTREAVQRAKRIYALYGKEDHVSLAIADSTHEYAPPLRQAAVNWFAKHLQGRDLGFVAGPLDPVPEPELRVTPGGQVLKAYSESRTLFDLNRDWFREAQPSLVTAEPDAFRSHIMETLGGQGDRSTPIYPRVIWKGEWGGCAAEKIFFFSEPGIVVTGINLSANDPGQSSPVDVVLLPNGTADGDAYEPFLRQRWSEGRSAFLFDVRGTGAVLSRETNPSGRNNVHGTEYRMAMDAMMLGISTLGLRVFDALRAYDYLRSRPDIGEVGIVGFGSAAIPAMFAGALEPGFARFLFGDAITSYQEIAEERYYSREALDYPRLAWGIARDFDLADLLRLYSSKEVVFVRPRNAKNEIQSEEEWERGFVRAADERGLAGTFRRAKDDEFPAVTKEEAG